MWVGSNETFRLSNLAYVKTYQAICLMFSYFSQNVQAKLCLLPHRPYGRIYHKPTSIGRLECHGLEAKKYRKLRMGSGSKTVIIPVTGSRLFRVTVCTKISWKQVSEKKFCRILTVVCHIWYCSLLGFYALPHV